MYLLKVKGKPFFDSVFLQYLSGEKKNMFFLFLFFK